MSNHPVLPQQAMTELIMVTSRTLKHVEILYISEITATSIQTFIILYCDCPFYCPTNSLKALKAESVKHEKGPERMAQSQQLQCTPPV